MLGENTPIGGEFAGMTLYGTEYAEKKEAGETLLEACRRMNSPDPVLIGSYRGFSLILSFDSYAKEYKLSMQGKITHTATLSTDVFGNFQRIEHVLNNLKVMQDGCKAQKSVMEQQMETAKAEAEKPFVYEKELVEKSARLAELNSLLNIDRKENEIADEEPDEEAEKEHECDLER